MRSRHHIRDNFTTFNCNQPTQWYSMDSPKGETKIQNTTLGRTIYSGLDVLRSLCNVLRARTSRSFGQAIPVESECFARFAHAAGIRKKRSLFGQSERTKYELSKRYNVDHAIYQDIRSNIGTIIRPRFIHENFLGSE